MQEVALASAVSIRVGKQQFLWRDLTNLSVVLGKVLLENDFVHKQPGLDKRFSSAKEFLEKANGLRDLITRKGIGHTSQPAPKLRETYTFLQARYGTKTEMEAAAAWMSHLLFLTRNLRSSEKHDKIYAILGVASFFSSKIDELVTPDYAQSIETVYTSSTAALILNSRFLSLLGHVGDISSNRLTGLPSWVPDYSTASNTDSILDYGKGHGIPFDASLTSESSPHPRTVEGTRLTLMGARFDQLTIVSPATLDQVIQDVCHFEEFIKFVTHLPDEYSDGQNRTETVWRTMTMDSEEISKNNERSPSAEAFQSWIINSIGLWVADALKTGKEADSANESARQFFTQLYPDTEIEVPKEIEEDDQAFTQYHQQRMLPFVQSTRRKVHGRKFFKTQNEFLGMGSRSVQSGDQVWLIRDSKTPLILRPKPDTQDFLLVGESYLHGFMHGEMLDGRWDLAKGIGPVTIV